MVWRGLKPRVLDKPAFLCLLLFVGATQAYRIDRGLLQDPKRMPSGQLKIPALLTRTGVLLYELGDGSIIKEYRPPSEVFNPQSMASLEAAFITNNHPVGMVTIADAKEHTVGLLDGQATRDGIHLAAMLTVFEENTLDDINHGKREVSCGYTALIEDSPGVTPEGEAYDTIQREIRYNHVAIVHEGRAGAACRLVMDAKDAIQKRDKDDSLSTNIIISLPAGGDPAKFAQQLQARLDGDNGDDMSNELKTKLDAALAAQSEAEARANKAEALCVTLKADLKTATSERDEHKGRADAAERTIGNAESKFDERVAERVELLSTGTRIMGPDWKPLNDDKSVMTNRQLQQAVITKVDSAAGDMSKESDDYVRGAYRLAVKGAVLGADGQLRAYSGGGGRSDDAGKDAPPSSFDARNAMVEDNRGQGATAKAGKE